MVAVKPSAQLEKTHMLALEMGRPYEKALSRAICVPRPSPTASQGCHPVPPAAGLLPGPALQLAPSLPAVTIHYLTFQLVAKRLVWRQKEEGDSARRKKEGVPWLSSLSSLLPSIFFPSSSLYCPNACTSGSMTGLPAQDENSKTSHSHP